MSGARIAVYGEGPNELGRDLGAALPRDRLPALPRLIDRILDEPEGATYCCHAFRLVHHVHGLGPKYAKKVKWLIHDAREQRFDGAVVLIDQDGKPDKAAAGALRAGRDEMAYGPYPPCAVGTAVKTFDAWMIADGKAVGQAGGDAKLSHPRPESLKGNPGAETHPKTLAIRIFEGRSELTQSCAAVAATVSIELLRRCCPKGFGPFAKEVAERLSPVAD